MPLSKIARLLVLLTIGIIASSAAIVAKGDDSDVEVLSNLTKASLAGLVIEERLAIERTGEAHVKNVFLLSTVGVDRDKYAIDFQDTIGGASVTGQANRHLQQGDGQAFAVLSGGFLLNYEPVQPSGLVKVSGKTLQGPQDSERDPILDGVVCFQDKKMVVMRAPKKDQSEARLSEYGSCLQAGPLLALDSQQTFRIDNDTSSLLKRFASGEYNRAFLMESKSGKVYFGYATKTSLDSLIRILLADESKGGFGAKHVLNLQGSTSAALIVYQSGKPIYTIGNVTAAQANTFLAAPIQK